MTEVPDEFVEPEEGRCEACDAPVLTAPAKNGGTALVLDPYYSTAQVVLDRQGRAMVASRAYSQHATTCAAKRKRA